MSMGDLALDTPVAVIDLNRLEKNIKDMAGFCQRAGVNLRPHVKSHKIPEIALAQIKTGAIGITVAKLGEAEVMAHAGVKDIFIANQITGAVKLRRLASLAQRIKLSVGLDSLENARELNVLAEENAIFLDVLVEVDSGLGRCGLKPGVEVLNLARAIQELPRLNFRGIFTHAGHAYGAANRQAVQQIGTREGELMAEQAEALRQVGISVGIVSVGSTPTAKFACVPGVTEIRPGNYVFNDAIQVALGAAEVEQCSLRVRARVISRPAPDRVVIDAGSKTLNLDKGAHGTSLVNGFGLVPARPGLLIERLSEEHGIVKVDPEEILSIGDVIEIIPNHACTVVNLFDQVLGERNGQVEVVFEVAARGQIR